MIIGRSNAMMNIPLTESATLQWLQQQRRWVKESAAAGGESQWSLGIPQDKWGAVDALLAQVSALGLKDPIIRDENAVIGTEASLSEIGIEPNKQLAR